MVQTPIHQEIEKVEDLLRGPSILRHSQLYSNKLNLKIKFKIKNRIVDKFKLLFPVTSIGCPRLNKKQKQK